MSDDFSKPVGGKVTGASLMGNPDLARFLQGVGGGSMAPQQPVAPAAPATPIHAEQVQLAPVAPTLAPKADDALLDPATLPDPQTEYLQKLEKLGVTHDQAARIVDAVVTQGFYEESVAVTKKLSVRFRTRGQEAADRVNKALNDENPQFTGSMYGIIAKYNLAASLVAYGPHKLEPTSEEGFQKSMEFLKRIPLPLYQTIVSKLAKFDSKLDAILTEGCVENFF